MPPHGHGGHGHGGHGGGRRGGNAWSWGPIYYPQDAPTTVIVTPDVQTLQAPAPVAAPATGKTNVLLIAAIAAVAGYLIIPRITSLFRG